VEGPPNLPLSPRPNRPSGRIQKQKIGRKLSAAERNRSPTNRVHYLQESTVIKLFLFCILMLVCWPLALGALILYPIVWLFLLPFRLVGIVVGGAFELIAAIFYLPARVLRSI